MVVDVASQNAAQMLLIEHDDMIKASSPNGSDA
jgi:hypothetical protein